MSLFDEDVAIHEL